MATANVGVTLATNGYVTGQTINVNGMIWGAADDSPLLHEEGYREEPVPATQA